MLILDEVSRAKDWTRAIPPLVYLRWVGAAAVGLGAIGILVRWLGLGPQRYVRKGMPLVARVVKLVKGPSLIMNGQATLYAFTATIKYRDPITGQLQQRLVKSPDFAAGRKDRYSTSFKIGDYLTAVYLPNRCPKSLQLFAFLELVPGRGLVRAPTFTTGKLWKIPLVTIAVALAHARGEALEVGASSFWGQRGLYGFVIKVLVIPGAFLIGGGTALCWCFSANALLDHSPTAFKAVQIESVKVGVVRYRLADSQETHEYRTTREMAQELALMPAVAEVHAGRLGWPWVKKLCPEAKK